MVRREQRTTWVMHGNRIADLLLPFPNWTKLDLLVIVASFAVAVPMSSARVMLNVSLFGANQLDRLGPLALALPCTACVALLTSSVGPVGLTASRRLLAPRLVLLAAVCLGGVVFASTGLVSQSARFHTAPWWVFLIFFLGSFVSLGLLGRYGVVVIPGLLVLVAVVPSPLPAGLKSWRETDGTSPEGLTTLAIALLASVVTASPSYQRAHRHLMGS